MNRIFLNLRHDPYLGAVLVSVALIAVFAVGRGELSLQPLIALTMLVGIGFGLPWVPSPAWRKEFRALSSVWLGFASVQFLLGLVTENASDLAPEIPFLIGAMGTAFLGATAFGHEFT